MNDMEFNQIYGDWYDRRFPEGKVYAEEALFEMAKELYLKQSDFRERCLKAIAELQETLEGVTINEVQAYRINSKIEGIKLALSYFDEMKGEK